MAEWFCSKCKVAMAEVDDIKLTYNEVELPEAPGLRCPQCGTEFLLDDYVTGELKSAEEMLEGK